MPSRLALAIPFVVLVSISGHAKNLGDTFQVGNWAGDAYSDDRTGVFSHCAAGVTYKSGIYLVASVARDFSWQLGLANLPIQLQLLGPVQVSVSFDDVGPYQIMAKMVDIGRNGYLLNMPMPSDNVPIAAFREANWLLVEILGNPYRFNLASTRTLLPTLSTCVANHIQVIPTEPPAVANAAPSKSPIKPEPNAEAVAARDKLMSNAGNEYNACIQSDLKDIVPYSSESAEIIAQVIITKREESQRHFTELSMALFGLSKSDAEKRVSDALDTRKKTIVADIVTFRAALNKSLSEQKGNEETKVKDKNGQGL